MDKSRKIDTFPQPFPSEKEKLNRYPSHPNNPLDSYYITENVDKELENTYKNYPDYVPVYLCNNF
jgi:hypothetical protein